jgi:hypothetical protein
MKQIFTVFVTGLCCLFAKISHAQFSENFDKNGTYAGNCWSFEGFFQTTDPTQVINGTASLYTNPPTNTNGSGTRDVHTPFLNLSSTTFSVSFNYKLSDALSGKAIRIIEVGLEDQNGVFTKLDKISMNSGMKQPTQTNTYSKTFKLNSTSVERLVLKFSGSQGDGNTRMIVDDLLTNANAYYGPTTNCNSAPVAASNSYNALVNGQPYIGTSVLLNDTDPNGETITASVATQPIDGTVLMKPDGTFTFTPNLNFSGTFTTFTYLVTDNGYNPLSTTATVNIYFPAFSTLPLTLLDFSGTVGSNKIILNWNVASNETGAFFEIQRSSNGSAWQPIAILFTSEQTGMEQYHYANAMPQQSVQYRLKLVNKDGTFTYSNVLSFTTAAFDQSLTLLQNPVQATLRFTVPVSVTRINGITIYSASGIKVSTAKTKFDKNNNTISMALQANLPTGTYILQVLTDAGSKTATFIKQ